VLVLLRRCCQPQELWCSCLPLLLPGPLPLPLSCLLLRL
jgi:hypothetical protein